MQAVRGRRRTAAHWIGDFLAGAIALAALISVLWSNEPFSLTMSTFREVNPCPSIKNIWQAQDASVPCPGYVIVPAKPRNHREWGLKWEPAKRPQER
jgi:hypothetical protein